MYGLKLLSITALISLTTFSAYAQSEELRWINTYNSMWSNIGTDILVDEDGSIYHCGEFSATVDFDPTNGVHNETAGASFNIFIQKLDSFGNLMWVETIGGTDWENANAMVVDQNGELVVTGFFSGEVEFELVSGDTAIVASGDRDFFILKMDSNGQIIWVRTFGGTNIDSGGSLVCDNENNIYVTGSYSGWVDLDPGPQFAYHNSNGVGDCMLMKLSPEGEMTWVNSLGGTGNDYGMQIDIYADTALYLVGYFEDVVDFDTGLGTDIVQSSGSRDAFLQRLDTAGNVIWTRTFGCIGEDRNLGVDITESGEIVVTGIFSDTVYVVGDTASIELISNGGADFFVNKYDQTGELIWAKSFGGSGHDSGYDIVLTEDGHPIVVGVFSDTIVFGGLVAQSLLSQGELDIFLLELNANGTAMWSKGFGGADNDGQPAVELDGQGNVLLNGYYSETVTFNFENANETHTSEGNADCFLLKMTRGVPSAVNEIPVVYNELSFFPNPTHGISSFCLDSRLTKVKFDCRNVLGQPAMYTVESNGTQGTIEILDKNGVYFFQAISETGIRQTVKLIKH
jgi:hypothetical protein